MSIFEHNSRARIYNPSQHVLVHDLSSFSYNNARLPGISLLGDALDYIVSVLYPNYIGTFATPAALPGVSTANDYAIVTDDGDGKSAGYVYTTIDGVSAWVKRYDVDWSLENILAETINRTQYMYVHKYGLTDKDAAGAAIVGTYAGQRIYGGDATGQNLTFNANSADATGYIQTDNSFRPTANGTLDLGTAALRFANGYINTLLAGTMTVAGGSITDSSGAISFDNENLTTTGSLNCAALVASGTATINSDIVISSGSITSTSGAISFGNENLTTTGTLASGTHTISSDLVLSTGSITSVSGAITFDNENLSTTGTLGAGNTSVTRLDSDNLRLDGNTLSVLNVNGNLILQANGTGVVDVQSTMTTLDQTVTGTLSVTGQLNADNLRFDGNVFSSTNLNGNITLTPNGSGLVELSSGIFPSPDSTNDIGKSGNVWNKLWIDGSIGGATEITVTDLMTLRSVPYRDFARTQAAQAGDTLFWDAVNQVWLANHPDTEITHSELTGLTTTDAGHTQFVMLAGRAGGQTVQGGTAASQNLTLESTAHATKGDVFTKDDFLPFTNASYSGGWSGTDIGGSSNYFKDVYTKGEFKGFRAENFTFAGLPASSAQNVGRLVWSTDYRKFYADTGSTLLAVTFHRHVEDTSWNGSDTSKVVSITDIEDVRNVKWSLHDNSGNFEEVYAKITASYTAAFNGSVTITVNVALPAGSYRLIGIG